ncbi:MAG: SoxR reducing system RseC family protein [Paludibacteraceae bacterium]|nr:SoxR reducing system RseC family protein [Paludibacteraceae bacterium]
MSELIKHEGIVLEAEGDKVRVKIVQMSACSQCQAKSMCMSADSKEKILDCTVAGEPCQPGDRVEVAVTQALGWKAILLAYILPFVVLMLCVAVIGHWVENEAVVGTIALCVTGVYYIVLSFFKNKLHKDFSFTAIKI